METLFKYVDEILDTEEMFLMFADKHSNPQQKANNNPRKPRDNQSITATPPSRQKSETKGISKPITKGSAKPSKAAVATIQSDSMLKPSNMGRDIRMGEPQTVFNTQLSDRPYLLPGGITVMENETKPISKVDVLLDTGAETSFIDSSLAAKLHVPVLEHKTIRLHTFGTKETKQEKCALVRLEGWDDEGTLHSLDLLTYEVLTRSFSSLQVSIEDQSFLNSLDISLPIRKDKKFVKPLILLGCDHLWSFMRYDKSAISLPSGLYLLPTKLGPIISGKAKSITSKTAQSMTSQLIQVFLMWMT
ncbi:Tas retrotransposon peptidase A16 [Necator americanus]|uniref:Tas retrotransposon peptidase A16 n=1 Tax=Necator americanus TaxID=51031 RepID=W2T2N6_NECAM|nr:Tas retrotransposon peptidase A16 [Necator americanus]ETN75809.1 Tas retrotransposon peptidase A16 [Necator americanus]